MKCFIWNKRKKLVLQKSLKYYVFINSWVYIVIFKVLYQDFHKYFNQIVVWSISWSISTIRSPTKGLIKGHCRLQTDEVFWISGFHHFANNLPFFNFNNIFHLTSISCLLDIQIWLLYFINSNSRLLFTLHIYIFQTKKKEQIFHPTKKFHELLTLISFPQNKFSVIWS